jgi:hypothetical protein
MINYGKKKHFLMGKLTISMVIFNSFLYVYQRVTMINLYIWISELIGMNHSCKAFTVFNKPVLISIRQF